jgi:hypothetical protein
MEDYRTYVTDYLKSSTRVLPAISQQCPSDWGPRVPWTVGRGPWVLPQTLMRGPQQGPFVALYTPRPARGRVLFSQSIKNN